MPMEIIMTDVIRSICQGCHCQCGVLVKLQGGKIVGITGDQQHPMNRGFICVKGRAQADLLYHSDRLKYPLKRVGSRGKVSGSAFRGLKLWMILRAN